MLPTALNTLLLDLSPMALAFSGGLDSRFLAHAALQLLSKGMQVKLYHITGPHVPKGESAAALAWARERGLVLDTVAVNPLENPDVRANNRNRCYYCKRQLFESLQKVVAGRKILCDGSNLSDQDSYRPGLRALKELGIRSPLAEAGLTKEQIRALAASSGMDRPNQAARPCLLTRFAYELAPTTEALAALENAERTVEEILKTAVASGFLDALPDFRLRLVSDDDQQGASLPFGAELHLNANLKTATELEVLRAISKEGFPKPRLVAMQRVSGHYDRSRAQ